MANRPLFLDGLFLLFLQVTPEQEKLLSELFEDGLIFTQAGATQVRSDRLFSKETLGHLLSRVKIE